MRSRTSENQEGWKDGSEERGATKTWADSVDPRAPSPGSVGQYSKLPASLDYQVQHVLITTSLLDLHSIDGMFLSWCHGF